MMREFECECFVPRPIYFNIHIFCPTCVILTQRVVLIRLLDFLGLQFVPLALRMPLHLPMLQNVHATQVFIGEIILKFSMKPTQKSIA